MNADDTESEDPPSMRFSLRITHFGDDPDAVTHILRIKPTQSGKVGDPYRLPTGRIIARRGLLLESFWHVLGSTSPHAPASDHISELTSVTRACNSFNELPAGTRVIFYGTFIAGDYGPDMQISHSLLIEMARIGADFEFNRIQIDPRPDPM